MYGLYLHSHTVVQHTVVQHTVVQQLPTLPKIVLATYVSKCARSENCLGGENRKRAIQALTSLMDCALTVEVGFSNDREKRSVLSQMGANQTADRLVRN
jgi:hypothetical protein